MFTGLVEALGTIVESRQEADKVGKWIEVEAPFANQLSLGESVSINGTCVTVVERTDTRFAAQLTSTTLDLTTLDALTIGQRVNLERSVTPTTRLGGHWVLGHVDTRGMVLMVSQEGESHHVTVEFPAEYGRWVMPQGSLALDGISLTVVQRESSRVTVTIIPHTWTHTIAHQWQPGQSVNIEFDALGKYVEQLLGPYQTEQGGITS